MKNTSMPNSVRTLEYVKCSSLSSSRTVKIPISSIRYNCQKICSWLRRPKTLLEMRKVHISLGDKQWYYLQVFQDSFNHRKKTNRIVVFSIILWHTTSMQSRLNVIYKSKFTMIFLTILGVTEILLTFIFVLEGKESKETSKSSTLEF